MSLLGQLGTQLASAALQRIATPRNVVGMSASLVPGGSMALAPLARAAVARPGTGFRTGGGFPALTGATVGFRKRRRTNPTNVRALQRALRRVEGFIRIEKRVDKILRKVAPRARAASRVGFVKRRK